MQYLRGMLLHPEYTGLVVVSRPTRLSSQTARGFAQARFASSLVLAEHDGKNLSAATLSAIGAVSKLGNVSVLVCGTSADAVAAEAGTAEGVTQVLYSKTDSAGMLPESITPIILASQKQFNFSHIVAAATAVGKVCECKRVCV